MWVLFEETWGWLSFIPRRRIKKGENRGEINSPLQIVKFEETMGWLWVLFEVILRFFVSSNLIGVLFEETIG
jgi:hypothetical protein